MPGSQLSNLALILKRAMRAPVSISMLGLGVLFALVFHDWIGIVILGGCITAVALYALGKLQDESYIRSTLREAGERRRRAELQSRTFRIEELSVESRVKMKAIVKLQSEIAEEVANSPVDEIAIGLADTVEQTELLADRGLALAQRGADLQRYLSRNDAGAIESRIHSLGERLREEQDATRRSEIEVSVAAKRKELEDHRAIEAASARVLDELDAIECSFASLKARLVRIKSTDIAEWASANEELKTELGGLSTAVDVVEQSINEALRIGQSGP